MSSNKKSTANCLEKGQDFAWVCSECTNRDLRDFTNGDSLDLSDDQQFLFQKTAVLIAITALESVGADLIFGDFNSWSPWNRIFRVAPTRA